MITLDMLINDYVERAVVKKTQKTLEKVINKIEEKVLEYVKDEFDKVNIRNYFKMIKEKIL